MTTHFRVVCALALLAGVAMTGCKKEGEGASGQGAGVQAPSDQAGKAKSRGLSNPFVGKPAPTFKLQTVDGKTVGLEDFRGKNVVLHFGTGWCPFCVAEAPRLESIWKRFKDKGVQVLVIDVKETPEKVKEYIDRCKYTMPVLLDRDGKVAESYAPPGAQPALQRSEVPIASNLLIDKKGVIRFYDLLDSAKFDAKLGELIYLLEQMVEGKL